MPSHTSFQLLHSTPLFEWIQKQPAQATWWLWGVIGILVIVTINTIFCSVESVLKKRKISRWLLYISPQIIHIGFLFMLLAHLLSAFGASQKMITAREGSLLTISDAVILKVKDIAISLDYYGYMTGWKVDVDYISGNAIVRSDSIMPNVPSVFDGFNINIKNLRAYPREIAVFQINREPGALWALAGSIVFMIGIVTLVILKVRIEK